MFTITVTSQTNAKTGKPSVIAKGHGKQRTVAYDHSKSIEGNLGSALGALVNVLTDARQQAMLKHPSGGQRVTQTYVTPGGSKRRFTINV